MTVKTRLAFVTAWIVLVLTAGYATPRVAPAVVEGGVPAPTPTDDPAVRPGYAPEREAR